MNGTVEQRGIERDITRLTDRFAELLEMVGLAQINFVAPDRCPMVMNRRLEITPARYAGGGSDERASYAGG